MKDIEKKINYQFKDKNLLIEALTHKSIYRDESLLKKRQSREFESVEKAKQKIIKEKDLKPPRHNERLEFLGDAVLSLAIAHLLMKTFPNLNEGNLSKIRAALVNEKSLASISSKLGLNLKLRVNEESKETKLNQKSRLKASVFEALIGAYFLDANYEKVYLFITQMFENLIEKKAIKSYLKMDYKSDLQEKLQKKYKILPKYSLDKTQGPDHKKTFYVKVYLGDKLLGHGEGQSKKEAEQKAAKEVLTRF